MDRRNSPAVMHRSSHKHPRWNVACLALVALAVAACQDSSEEDGAGDSFLDDGKSDTGGIREGTSTGYAVLRVANESDAAGFAAAGVSTLTAKHILAYRSGVDGQLGTSDDNAFDTLAELDAVPYTGPVLFRKLRDRAMELGYIVFDWRTHVDRAWWNAAKPTMCTINGPAEATALRILLDIQDDPTWRIDVRNTSGTLVQSIYPPFSGWSSAVEGNALTYSVGGAGGYIDCEQFRGLVQAYAAREPVAIDDPFRCTTFVNPSTPTPSGAQAGELGSFALPDVNLWSPTYPDAFAASCGAATVAIKFTPPTDGVYTFRSFDHRRISVRDGGCSGTDLACDSKEVTVKLHEGVAVAIGVGSTEPGGTLVTVIRATTEVSCDDGFDDNGDGAIDCADPSCASACRAVENCTNNIDDNMNGKLDCLDSDCSYSQACSSNTCPGVDLGTKASATGPITGGNGLLAPAGQWLACGSTALPWEGSRFYSWRAPSAGTYLFSVTGSGLYDYGLKLHDGTCDGDELACKTKATYNAGALLTLTAGQPLVIEVGLSRYASTFGSSSFQLSISKQ